MAKKSPIPSPFGCKHCGIAKDQHGRQYSGQIGWHEWARPDAQQMRDRHKARREVIESQRTT